MSPNSILRSHSLVVARYADDSRWYRAWIKSINAQSEQAMVFFVDFGNESSVAFDDIRPCPESIRTLPWLGIRVRLVNETMTYDELAAFWKLAESNYIWIRIVEVLTDSYSVQIKLDYTVILRQERLKLLSSPRLVHAGVQVDTMFVHFTKPALYSLSLMCCRPSLMTPCTSVHRIRLN